MITVALDAMGGDRGVEATVGGAARLSREESDVHTILVGDVTEMSRVLEDVRYDASRITLVAADGYVRMNENPAESLDANPHCSVLEAARLVVVLRPR